MKNTFMPYSNSVNLERIRSVSLEVVQDVAPDEELSAEKLANSLIKEYEMGKLPLADTSLSRAGGFGNVDLVVLVIIPVIVAVLQELGKELVKLTFDEIKKAIEADDATKKKAIVIIEESVEREYQVIVEKVKSKKSGRRQKIIKQKIKIHIKRRLGIIS